MATLQSRIETLLEVTERWLSNDNEYLMEAAGRTVDEGFFAVHDVKFALKAIKKSINQTALKEWIKDAGLSDEKDASGQNVLCLHAGNLPLVGFQDAFSALLSGARYIGKISRKDPYLLPTFLNEVKKTAVWTDMDVQWSHRLDDFEDMRNDVVIFAGSESSVPGVMEAINNLNLSTEKTRYLIRTAHFSMAYLDRQDERTMKDLVEGIFRYGGKGCRSVAIVVSPFSLNSIKCELTDYIETFWLENPQLKKPSPKLKQQFAYNKAIERSQVWLDDFLLQEGGLELNQDFVCYWMQGDESTVAELAKKYADELQSIYITRSDIEVPGFENRTEILADAQQPPINWKPDGMDTLEWLKK
jgi:hypothetical protein